MDLDYDAGGYYPEQQPNISTSKRGVAPSSQKNEEIIYYIFANRVTSIYEYPIKIL